MSSEKAKLFSFSRMLKEQERKAGVPLEGIPEEGIPVFSAPIPPEGIPVGFVPAPELLPRDADRNSLPASGIPPTGIPSPGIPKQDIPSPGIPEDDIPAEGIPLEGIPQQNTAESQARPVTDEPASKSRRPKPGPVIAEPSIQLTTALPDTGIPQPGIPQHSIPTITHGYYQCFNDLDDRICPTLDVYGQVVLRRLYRLSHGYGSTRCKVGLGTLAVNTNMARSRVQRAIADLIEQGLIQRLGSDQNGAEYEVLPGAVPIRGQGIPRKGIPPISRGIPQQGTQSSRGIPQEGNNKEKKAFKENINTEETINQSIQTFRDLLQSGDYTIEMIEEQFSAGFSKEEWEVIIESLQEA